ncbi:MAG: peptidoglycan-binding protein [Candidatus Omnitrophica bacterium]|nr:peptidoglycan-binding protein [Candidatus Omnitrophota bacterium]MCM8823155.1 peptidoglycan-binding protein [Candidatus Omnitrophota bacterium]
MAKAKVSSVQEKEGEKKVYKLSAKKIQLALKNAGFYDGPIDGKIGDKTRKAIKEFQKANGLTPDGIVGRRTIAKLVKYLN